MKSELILLFSAVVFVAGCESKPHPKPTLERGWIGGEYRCAGRSLVPKGVKSGVYVQQVYAGTPAEQAGLKPGDLLLAVNNQPAKCLKDFRRLVDAASPGTQAKLRVLRDGQTQELPLTIGRETYNQWHSFSLGLQASSQFDLWPNPDFSLLPLAFYKRPVERVELRSPEVRLAKSAGKKTDSDEPGTKSDEGWDAWFVIFGFNAHKRILAQETVPGPTSKRDETGPESVEQRISLLKGEIDMLKITLKSREDEAAKMRWRLEPINIQGESIIKTKRDAAYPTEQVVKDLETTAAILRRQIAGVSEETHALDIVLDLGLRGLR
jgi:hypothetical protein